MWTIGIILLCIALNAALAGLEISYVSVNKAIVKDRAEKEYRAKILLDLKNRPERTLSTIQIGITLLGALSAAVGGAAAGLNVVPLLQQRMGMNLPTAEVLAILFVVIPITYLSVVIGEITPKALAIRNPYYFASLGAPLLKFLNCALHPLSRVCEISTKGLLKLFPMRGGIGEEKESWEYERIVSGYIKLPRKGKEYMINLSKIQEVTLCDILLPWNNVDVVKKGQSLEEVEEKIIASGHTRMPVVENEKVLGLINTKEVLAFSKSNGKNWEKLMHEPIFFSKDGSLLRSLSVLQNQRAHMAIVENDDSKPLGIVTIEDIIEEILGEIYDEDDEGSLQRILKKEK